MDFTATTDDEKRLLVVFRSLPFVQRDAVLREATERAMELLLPENSVYDHMPAAAGVEPERIHGSIHEEATVVGTICEILRDGIEATGEPSETLLGSGEDDAEHAERFASSASATATRQGSFFHYDREFAQEYIMAWRWEIVAAIARKAGVLG